MYKLPYIPILKCKEGELTALSHYIVHRTCHNISPLIEILPQDLDKDGNKARSDLDYVDKKITNIKKSLLIDDNPLFDSSKPINIYIDNSFCDPNALLENQVHPLEYICKSINTEKVVATPVIGYDRWFDEDEGSTLYIDSLRNLALNLDGSFCIRINDFYHAQYAPLEFDSNLRALLDTLQLNPDRCSVLLDFGDTRKETPESICSDAKATISMLSLIGFDKVYICGGSAPQSVGDVAKPNTSDVIPRIEFKAWKILTETMQNIGFSDYGVRHPESSDSIQNPNINAKIIYTSEEALYVARGESLRGLSGSARSKPFKHLAEELIKSGQFAECSDCWGDIQILSQSMQPSASLTNWVGFSTNRHLCYVTDEVVERRKLVFEKSLREADIPQSPA